jgi:squalene synthase HpnC
VGSGSAIGTAGTCSPRHRDPTPDLVDERQVARRAGGENFPVASRALPRAARAHLLAIYGFARLVDDTGDDAPRDRLGRLDALEHELDRAYAGRATHPVFVRLAPSLRELELPDAPFRALIEANRRDQIQHRYATWDDLRSYCALSAEPVGHLVLAVFGAATPERLALSDDVCTALQLVEHLQDVGEDFARGRVYLPAEDLERFGCLDPDLAAPRAGAALRQVVAFEARRARTLLLAAGPALSATLTGRVRVAVAGFTGGGLAALDSIERVHHDVLGSATRPTRRGVARRAMQVLVSRGGRR